MKQKSTRIAGTALSWARYNQFASLPVTKCRYATTRASPEIFDVVCVGGGPAGLSILTGLRASRVTNRLKVALIEGQDLRRASSTFDGAATFSNRCSSLTPTSVAHLKQIGAWPLIDGARVQPYQEMQVWDGVTGSRISFDWAGPAQGFTPVQDANETIAYMIENNNLTQGLYRRLSELQGVSVLSPNRVQSITHGEEDADMDLRNWPVVTLDNGQKLAARLLIGADGANSPVRMFAGIQSRGWDYNRNGVVATLQLEDAGRGGESHKIAYQRFLPTGPVAMLPLPGNAATLVWSTTPERAARLKSLQSADFVAMVNAAFRLSPVELTYLHDMAAGQEEEVRWREETSTISEHGLPSRVTSVVPGTVAPFPLKMRHADTYTGERVALVGDAAHTIHPLAGQGLNQGQGDAAALVKTIEAAVQSGADIGSQMSLEAYNSERYQSNNMLLGVVDKLHKLYSIESGPLVPLRSIGLSAVDKLTPLKRFFMRSAASTA